MASVALERECLEKAAKRACNPAPFPRNAKAGDLFARARQHGYIKSGGTISPVAGQFIAPVGASSLSGQPVRGTGNEVTSLLGARSYRAQPWRNELPRYTIYRIWYYCASRVPRLKRSGSSALGHVYDVTASMSSWPSRNPNGIPCPQNAPTTMMFDLSGTRSTMGK